MYSASSSKRSRALFLAVKSLDGNLAGGFAEVSLIAVDRLILPKDFGQQKKLRANMLIAVGTGIPFAERRPGRCLKNADQYTYNQTALHKPNTVNGVLVIRASLFRMVGNAYVASSFADLHTDHTGFRHDFPLRGRRRIFSEVAASHFGHG